MDSLPPWIRDWIRCEQTVNDRVSHPRLAHRFSLREKDLAKKYWPESREIFQLEYVLLDREAVLDIGPARDFLADRFGFRVPRNKRAIFVHPGNLTIKRKLDRAGIPVHVSEIVGTPTSSFRSLLCWHPALPEQAAVMKLALHVPISGVTRLLAEIEVFASVHTSRLLKTIPDAHKETLGLDFFIDTAGSYCRPLKLGQIFRLLPDAPRHGGRIVPAFSFGSRDAGEWYLSRTTPSIDRGLALMENLVASYVRTTSYLLLREGITHEFHPQNVLFDIQGEHVARVILRDFFRAAVSPRLRRCHQRPMPTWKDHGKSRHKPSTYLYHRMARRAPTAYLRVFGIRGVIWEWSRALRLLTGKQYLYDMQRLYLRYW